EAADRRSFRRPQLQWAVAMACLAVVLVAGAAPLIGSLGSRTRVPVIVQEPTLTNGPIGVARNAPNPEVSFPGTRSNSERENAATDSPGAGPIVGTDESAHATGKDRDPYGSVATGHDVEAAEHNAKRQSRVRRHEPVDFLDVQDAQG